MGYSPEYVAGVLDSDGSIFIQKSQRPNENIRYSLRVTIGQYRWDDFYDFLEKNFGGKSSAYPSRNNMTEWVLCGKNCEEFLRWIEPHLHIKREQANIALAFLPTIRVGGNHKGDHNATGKQQAPLFEAMQLANTRVRREY